MSSYSNNTSYEADIPFDVYHSQLEQRAKEKYQKDGNLNAFRSLFHTTPGQEHAALTNSSAFNTYPLMPRILSLDPSIPMSVPSASLAATGPSGVLGTRHPLPFILAPVHSLNLIHPEGRGDIAAARAASDAGVPFVLSEKSISDTFTYEGENSRCTAFQDVASISVDRVKWFQLSFPLDLNKTLPIISLAKAYSFSVLVLSVNSPYSSPLTPASDDRRAKDKILWTWSDIPTLRKHWGGKIVLKGVLHVHDAEQSVDYVDGVIVSNHGSSSSGLTPALPALYKIGRSMKIREAQSSSKFTLLFDSGIRNGSDIIKAVAFGAQSVLIGAPYVLSLFSSESELATTLQRLQSSILYTLRISGYSSLAAVWHNRHALDLVENYAEAPPQK